MAETREPFGGPKVGDLDLSAEGVNEDVVALDVTMDDALVMEVFDSLQDLTGVVTNGGLVERAPSVFEQVREAPCPMCGIIRHSQEMQSSTSPTLPNVIVKFKSTSIYMYA